jgi:hypothetical protein
LERFEAISEIRAVFLAGKVFHTKLIVLTPTGTKKGEHGRAREND